MEVKSKQEIEKLLEPKIGSTVTLIFSEKAEEKYPDTFSTKWAAIDYGQVTKIMPYNHRTYSDTLEAAKAKNLMKTTDFFNEFPDSVIVNRVDRVAEYE